MAFGEQFWMSRGLGDADAVGLGTMNCTGGDRIAARERIVSWYQRLGERKT